MQMMLVRRASATVLRCRSQDSTVYQNRPRSRRNSKNPNASRARPQNDDDFCSPFTYPSSSYLHSSKTKRPYQNERPLLCFSSTKKVIRFQIRILFDVACHDKPFLQFFRLGSRVERRNAFVEAIDTLQTVHKRSWTLDGVPGLFFRRIKHT